MSVKYNNEEADRLLAEAALILADEPGLTPELLDTVASPTMDAGGMEGMAPHEGSEGELRKGEGLCQGPPSSIALTCLRYTVVSALDNHIL